MPILPSLFFRQTVSLSSKISPWSAGVLPRVGHRPTLSPSLPSHKCHSSSSRFRPKRRIVLAERQLVQTAGSHENANKRFVWAVIAVNVGLFGTWKLLQIEADQSKDTTKLRKMFDNFTLSVSGIREGRWWTAVTSSFFHVSFTHLLFNCFTFHFMGNMVAATRGVRVYHLATLLAGSAVFSSGAYLCHTSMYAAAQNRPALGFSGIAYGFLAAAVCLHPTSTLMIWGVVECPAWLFGLLLVGYDSYYLHDQTSFVGHSAHLGGAAFGVAYYLLQLRKRNMGGILTILKSRRFM